MASTPEPIPQPPARDRTVVFVSTHCPVRNWAEKRLYDPLAEDCRLHSVFWDRSHLLSARGLEEAERYRIALHEFPNRPWGPRTLWQYFGYVVRELDRIQAQDGVDFVVAADPDVLPPVLWHRMTRRLRYRVYREEVDYYAGSRGRGRGLRDRAWRLALDAAEALLHTQCDRIVTLNRYAKERLLRWGVPERKVVIGGLWKKDEYFTGDREAAKVELLRSGAITPAQYEVLKGRVVISFFGLFYEFTHLRELLDVVREYPADFALITAGKGADLPVVEEYARRHPNILFFGWIDEDELKAYYTMTDIVYQPLNPEENPNWKYFGSTNKTFESLAAGCLFIGSNINERIDLNAQAEFSVPVDFSRDIRGQLHELFREIRAHPGSLHTRQRNARRLFERYNHAEFARIWRPLFREPGR
jgi:hypothetical protein